MIQRAKSGKKAVEFHIQKSVTAMSNQHLNGLDKLEEEKKRNVLMLPLSDAGKQFQDEQSQWELLKNREQLSEDSDTIRERLWMQEAQQEDELAALV